MTGGEVMDVARQAIWVLLQMSGPVLGVALIVGLIIALFQALTQIQEMTLTFVPKIIAIFMSLLVLLPFMAQTLSVFMTYVTDRITAM